MDTIKIISKKKKKVELNVSVFVYKEDGLYVSYCPSLDLMTTGDTPSNARANFKELLFIYIKCCVEKGTLSQDLEKHGWTLEESTETIKQPSFASFLKLPEMKHILSLNFDKRNISTLVPAF